MHKIWELVKSTQQILENAKFFDANQKLSQTQLKMFFDTLVIFFDVIKSENSVDCK